MTVTEKYLLDGGSDWEYVAVLSYVETASWPRVFSPSMTYAESIKNKFNHMTDADLLASDSIY